MFRLRWRRQRERGGVGVLTAVLLRLGLRRQRERGGVAVLTAVLLGTGVILGMGALVIDVGGLYTEREQLQSGADAAALVAAKSCSIGNCTSLRLPTLRGTAEDYAGRNDATDGRADVAEMCGNWGDLPTCSAPAGTLGDCIGAPPAGNYVEVRVKTKMRDGSTVLPPTFATTLAGNSKYRGKTVSACSRATAANICAHKDEMTYTHTFDGANGRATITPDRPMCPGERQAVTLVAYTAPDDAFAVPQYVYDHSTQDVTSATDTLRFKVEVPPCFTQVDFVFEQPINPLWSADYGDRKLGAPGEPGRRSVGPHGWYHGGTVTCSPEPSVAFTPQCDRKMQLRLSNAATANVDAVFTVKETGKIYRVGKSKPQTVTVPVSSAGTVTVEDNKIGLDGKFRTTTGQWTQPQDCC